MLGVGRWAGAAVVVGLLLMTVIVAAIGQGKRIETMKETGKGTGTEMGMKTGVETNTAKGSGTGTEGGIGTGQRCGIQTDEKETGKGRGKGTVTKGVTGQRTVGMIAVTNAGASVLAGAEDMLRGEGGCI